MDREKLIKVPLADLKEGDTFLFSKTARASMGYRITMITSDYFWYRKPMSTEVWKVHRPAAENTMVFTWNEITDVAKKVFS